VSPLLASDHDILLIFILYIAHEPFCISLLTGGIKCGKWRLNK
jgi:hypothetical protein